MDAILIMSAFCATIPAQTPDARPAVLRSLTFLEQGGVSWIEQKKCASCHHAPMAAWTHHEAERLGVIAQRPPIAALEKAMVEQYLGHETFQPTGQDRSFLEKPLGPGTAYVALALAAAPNRTMSTADAWRRFSANFAAHQEPTGEWKTKLNQPPLVDGNDSMTALFLLAADPQANPESFRKSADWLREQTLREETQPLALRLMVETRMGRKEDVQRLSIRLLEWQRDDGGWGQTKERPSDALATGQALVALLAADRDATSPSIQKAVAFLRTSQRDDGSWLVKTRNKNGHDPIISYYGTGWATLGLLRYLAADAVATAELPLAP